MGFKLVRVDTKQPYKVILPLGSHFVGRGKFLDCNDKRVSRNHAELIVTEDSVSLKSLHQNPCFLKKKSSTEAIIFSQPDSQPLSNGDQFGVLPERFWYEVILCTEESYDKPIESNDLSNVCENENPVNENGDTQLYNREYENENILNNSESLLDHIPDSPFQFQQENMASPPEEPGNRSENSPKDNLENMDSTSTEQAVEPTNNPVELSVELTGSARTVTPTKRMHSEENSPCDIKRVKTESEESPEKDSKDEVKTEPHSLEAAASNQGLKIVHGSSQNAKAGPSNDQGGPSSNSKGNPPAMPPSPTKPPSMQLRERCTYGANCYRRNPQHKAQFSHPADSDWGAGPRGVCPWGAGCQKRDPRHWRDHDHPPGAQPPPPRAPGNRPGMQLVRRHGNNYYINANTVNFYDDHFQVEDSDGDSVDYDYEF